MQIRYMHKLTSTKLIFLKIGKFARRFEPLRFETVMHHMIDFLSIKSKLLLSNKISCASHF